MDDRNETRADLARRLGISRARVTQVLQVLDLDEVALQLLERHPGPGMVPERGLRDLRTLAPPGQRERMAMILDRLEGDSAVQST